MSRYILMSIRPLYAQRIKSGEKTVELRRVIPKATNGDSIVFYESRPIQMITTICKIENILSLPPEQLWHAIGDKSCVDKKEYDRYFNGVSNAHGIILKDVSLLKKPKKLQELFNNYFVPQSFCYISQQEFNKLTE